jgi:hypothetical protein
VLRSVLIHSTTKEDIRRAADALKTKVFAGDVPAIKLFFQYVLGKPAEAKNPDRIGIDEWENLRDTAVDPEELGAVLDRCPTAFANALAQECWNKSVQKNFGDAMKEHAELEALVAEDERYMEELEKAEEAALRQKQAGYAEPQAPAPAAVESPSTKGQTAPAASASASLYSPKGIGTGKGTGTGAFETCHPAAPSPIGFQPPAERNAWLHLIDHEGMNETAHALLDKLQPSTNGDRPDGDGSP